MKKVTHFNKVSGNLGVYEGAPGSEVRLYGTEMGTGTKFYLDSGAGSDANNGSSWLLAYATMDKVLSMCTADNGDVIFVAPGHAETVSAAAGMVFDVAGVTIIGFGNGTLKPTITLDTANTADIDVTAANVTIANFIFSANYADIAVCIDLDAKNFTLENCEFLDTAGDMDFVVYIDCDDTANACDGLTVRNCTVLSPDVANDHFIAAVGDIDRLTVEDCFITMGVNNGEAIIEASTGKDFTNCLIRRNAFSRGNTEAIVCMESDTTANSGMIYENYIGHLDVAAATPFDVTGAMLFENYALGVTDASGLLLPAVDGNS